MATNAYGWGKNLYGTLGIGDIQDKSSPVAILGGYSFSQISSGATADAHAGGLVSTDIYMWGHNYNGKLGVGNTNNYSSPVPVLGSRSYKYLCLGTSSSYGLDMSGNCFSWGYNIQGQLGTNNRTNYSSPVAMSGGIQFSKLAPNTHFLGIRASDGNIFACGANSSGQLGTGNITSYSVPTAIVGNRSWIDVTSGGATSWAIEASTGYILGWGGNTQGQLGTGNRTNYSSPVAMLGNRSYSKIAGGGTFILAIEASTGYVYACGRNHYGQLGTGDMTSYSSPVAISGNRSYSIIEANISGFSMGLSGGAGYSWGYNFYGQLDTGNKTSYSSPVATVSGNLFNFLTTGDNCVFGFLTPIAPSGNIKKWNYVLWANVKKVNGVGFANIKKLNGVTA